MKLPYSVFTKDFKKMASETSFSLQVKVIGTFLPLLLILQLSFPLYAQINASKGIPSFTNYVVGDIGIAGQQVWNVGQDTDGYIYVGTSSGLQKFDGKNWELLTSPTTEFNTNVRATLLSSDGTFYYGSLGDFGIVARDSIGRTLEKSLLDNLKEDVLFNDIWSICEIKGKIYFQARDAIFIYSTGTENEESSIQVWKPDTQFMYGFELNGVYYAHQMNLGLYRDKDGILELIPKSEFLGEDRVQVLLPYQGQDDFLVAAFSGGLFHYNGEDFKPFPTEIDAFLQDGGLYKALALPDSTYALSTLGYGFFIMDRDGKVKSDFNIKNSIPDQSVYAFHLDNTDNLWVGTNSGLSKIEIFSPLTRFDSDTYEIGSPLSLKGFDNTLYIGTSTNVLYVDKADGTVKKVDGIANTQVFGLVADDNQVLSTGDGIYKIQGSKASIIQGTESFPTLKVLISNMHAKYVFISGDFGVQVFKRELDSQGVYQYENIGPVSGVSRAVYSLAENKEGDLWGGTQAGVLYRITFPKTASGNLNVSNAVVEEFSEKNGIRGLSGQAIGPIDGKVYTSGIEGYYFFNSSSKEFEKDQVFSFSDEVASINLDTYGLGIGETGNVILDFKGEKRYGFLQPDGSYKLEEYPVNLITSSRAVSSYTESSGVIWLGTDEGLIRIDPNKPYKTDYPVPLYFSSISSGEESLRLAKETAGPIPKIEFKGNSISFNYAAPFFLKENQIRYQTFLEGLDEEWGKWEDKSYRDFSNLPHGTYAFRIRAKNAFNTISDEIAYSFVILPPWYATWWAYVLYFLGFGFLVFGLVRVQTGRILAREKEKNREKELAQAKEIEKAYEDLKATQAQLIQSEKMASLGELTAGIAHEIQNPLNFVNNFSELNTELIEELEEEANKGNLEEIMILLNDLKGNERKIIQHGKRASSIVKGMLAHSRNAAGEKQSVNINVLAEEYLKLSYHGLRAKDKSFQADFKMEFEPNLPKVNVVPQDIGRVFLNIINNAFQACTMGREPSGLGPLVTVSTKNLGDAIQVSISDNGPGIPEAIKDKIFQPFFTTKAAGQGTGLGLSLSYDIIKAHGGELNVESIEGEGTVFKIQIPIV
jgi:signal transduction histidine kinase/ligand-binding sensor domain-containing protein